MCRTTPTLRLGHTYTLPPVPLRAWQVWLLQTCVSLLAVLWTEPSSLRLKTEVPDNEVVQLAKGQASCH